MLKSKYEAKAKKSERFNDFKTLFEFGFTDYRVNNHLLEKY